MTEGNIGFDYLCDDKVQDSKIFFHILQAQKDGIYNYFARKQESIMSRMNKKKPRKFVNENDLLAFIDGLRQLRTQVWALHQFLERNLASFKDALWAYDEKHGTDTFEEEIEDLLSTHTLMNGNWTLNVISLLNKDIESYEREEGKDLKCRFGGDFPE